MNIEKRSKAFCGQGAHAYAAWVQHRPQGGVELSRDHRYMKNKPALFTVFTVTCIQYLSRFYLGMKVDISCIPAFQ